MSPGIFQHYSSRVPPVKWITIQHNWQSVSICLNLRITKFCFFFVQTSYLFISIHLWISAPHHLLQYVKTFGLNLAHFFVQALGWYFQWTKKKTLQKTVFSGKKCSKCWSKTVWPLDINYSRLWGVIWVGMEFTLEVSLSLSGPFCFKCVIWDLQYNMRMYYALWRYTNWQRWLNAV